MALRRSTASHWCLHASVSDIRVLGSNSSRPRMNSLAGARSSFVRRVSRVHICVGKRLTGRACVEFRKVVPLDFPGRHACLDILVHILVAERRGHREPITDVRQSVAREVWWCTYIANTITPTLQLSTLWS